MNSETLARLVLDHRAFPDLLEAAVAGVPDETLRDREVPERWSPLEILRHLLDEETEDFGARARFIVEGGEEPARIAPASWVAERRYNEADPGETLAAFAAARAESCAWLETVSPADLEREFRVTADFTLKAGDVIAAWRVHDLLHLRQLTATLATLTARRLAPWNAGYAGAIPYLD